ncbi:hypothetical protein [Streptomyces sp. NPDC050564]
MPTRTALSEAEPGESRIFPHVTRTTYLPGNWAPLCPDYWTATGERSPTP